MSLKLDNYNERKGEFEGRGGGSCVAVLLCSFLRLWGFLYTLFDLRCVSLEYSRMTES